MMIHFGLVIRAGKTIEDNPFKIFILFVAKLDWHKSHKDKQNNDPSFNNNKAHPKSETFLHSI